MEKYLASKLQHLSYTDRKKAVTLLCAIGVEFIEEKYDLEPTNEFSLLTLNRYCDHLFREKQLRLDKRCNLGVDTDKETKPTNKEATPISHVKANPRHSRSDSMANYPFVDNSGSVGSVLHCTPGKTETDADFNNSGVIDLSKTTVPGRMRLITKIYHEICSSGDKVGMKHSDIPVALKALGIQVSPQLEHLLISGVGLHKNQPETAAYGNFTVNLVQFQDIVKKCMNIQNRKLNSGKSQTNPLESEADNWTDNTRSSDSSPEHTMDMNNKNGNDCCGPSSALMGLLDDVCDDGKDGRLASKSQRKMKESPNKLKVRHTNASLQRKYLNAQDSSPSEDRKDWMREQRHSMRQDRMHYLQRKKAEEVAVNRTVAEYKMKQYTDHHNHGSYFDWRKAGTGTGDHDSRTSPNSTADKFAKSGTAKYNYKAPYSLSTNSGDVVNCIADSFLNGPVGRGILSSSNPSKRSGHDDIDTYGVEGSSANMDGFNNTGVYVNTRELHSTGDRSNHVAENVVLTGVKTIAERREANQDEYDLNEILYGNINNPKIQSQYTPEVIDTSTNAGGSKWKVAKGGWVADFGPLHTHNLQPFIPATANQSNASTGKTANQSNASTGKSVKKDQNIVVTESTNLSSFHAGPTYGVMHDKSKHKTSTSGSGVGEMVSGVHSLDQDTTNRKPKPLPVRSYEEISETYKETGVKPWKQVALLKKYYGQNQAFPVQDKELPEDLPEPEFRASASRSRASGSASGITRADKAATIPSSNKERATQRRVTASGSASGPGSKGYSLANDLLQQLDVQEEEAGSDALDYSTFDINRNINRYDLSTATATASKATSSNSNVAKKAINDITSSSYYAYYDANARTEKASVTHKKNKSNIEEVLDALPLVSGASSSHETSPSVNTPSDGSISDLDLNKIKLPSHLNYHDLSSDSGL